MAIRKMACCIRKQLMTTLAFERLREVSTRILWGVGSKAFKVAPPRLGREDIKEMVVVTASCKSRVFPFRG